MKFFRLKLFAVLFLGIVFYFVFVDSAKAEILWPDGAGNWSEWQNTGGAGAGVFGELDDYPAPDDDTTYNKIGTALAKQSYSLLNTNKTTGTIRNIKIWMRAKSAGTADNIKVFFRIGGAGGTDYFSDPIAMTTGYVDYYFQWNTNPQTTTAWTIGDLNSLEAGFRLEGGTSEHRVTMIYAQVEYDSEIKTSKYHVTQKLTPINDGQKINDEFNFYIADDLDEVKDAYIEIKGLSMPHNPLYIDVSVDESGGSFPIGSPRLKTYTIDATGRVMPIKLIYDATDYFKTFVTGPGNYSRYFNLKVTGDSVYVLNAKLILTYSWVKQPPVTGAYKPYGDLVSSTFDTGSTSGAAYNSILWKGEIAQPVGTKVKFQLAVSGCQNGATNSPTCNSGAWGSGSNFIGGSDCDSNNWWEPVRNEPTETKCYSQLNNKRYFRYKIRLCSSDDCATSGNATPQVDDVVINFSP